MMCLFHKSLKFHIKPLNMKEQPAALSSIEVMSDWGEQLRVVPKGNNAASERHELCIVHPDIDLCFECYLGEGFSIWWNHYRFARPISVRSRLNTPALELQFPMRHVPRAEWDGKKAHMLSRDQCALVYVPFIDHQISFEAGKLYEEIDLHFSTAFLTRLLPQAPVLGSFLEDVGRMRPVLAGNAPIMMHPAIYWLLGQLKDRPLLAGASPLYYEGIVLQILALVLEGWSEGKQRRPLRLTGSEVEYMAHLHKLITSGYDTRYSLQALARIAGMNPIKLVNVFRQLYGCSPAELVQERRMNEARHLLLDTQMDISSIALRLGYSDAVNFIAAFKKTYGTTPGHYRRAGSV